LARAPGEPLAVLGQRGMAVLLDQRPDDVVARGGDLRRRAAGVRLGRPAPVLARLLAPEIHGRQTDAELGRDLHRPRAGFAGQQRALAQIGRVGLGHFRAPADRRKTSTLPEPIPVLNPL
jgi:hypothetical protein